MAFHGSRPAHRPHSPRGETGAVFDYAHATVRDEDYALVAGLQANLESGAREHFVFGRNAPGLQHRHQTWSEAISRRT
jgi:ring hydroxylating enzyme alpha subunit